MHINTARTVTPRHQPLGPSDSPLAAARLFSAAMRFFAWRSWNLRLCSRGIRLLALPMKIALAAAGERQRSKAQAQAIITGLAYPPEVRYAEGGGKAEPVLLGLQCQAIYGSNACVRGLKASRGVARCSAIAYKYAEVVRAETPRGLGHLASISSEHSALRST